MGVLSIKQENRYISKMYFHAISPLTDTVVSFLITVCIFSFWGTEKQIDLWRRLIENWYSFCFCCYCSE